MLTLVTGATKKILLTPTKSVTDPLALDIQKLLPEMVETMRREHGVGLAAPQVGLPLRLAVTEIDKKVYYLINPEITSFSQETVISEEGCLSLPEQFFPVVRSEHITLKYQNEKGLPKRLHAQGFFAIVIQHEVDHLNGILICNRFQKQQKKYKSLIKNYGGLA